MRQEFPLSPSTPARVFPKTPELPRYPVVDRRAGAALHPEDRTMADGDIAIARRLGARAFAGVVDKGGRPYWGHCERVAERVARERAGEAAIAAALLHDIVEDNLATPQELAHAGLSERALRLIEALTRPKDRAYMDYLGAIAQSRDRELILIKLADNADNMDPARIALLPAGVRHRPERYAAARVLLLAALKAL